MPIFCLIVLYLRNLTFTISFRRFALNKHVMNFANDEHYMNHRLPSKYMSYPIYFSSYTRDDTSMSHL